MGTPGRFLGVYIFVFCSISASSIAQSLGVTPSFLGLGHLSDAHYSGALGVSADGSVVVGLSERYVPGVGYFDEGFRWTIETGIVGLGFIPGGGPYSIASGVSDDGAVVVGTGSTYSILEAVRWTTAGGVMPLSSNPGAGNPSRAYAASANGSVIVGSRTNAFGTQAYRWTNATGMALLGDLPGGDLYSEATGVSSDGSVVVGFGTNSPETFQAFRWTNNDGLVAINSPWASLESTANGVSGNGNVVVGYDVPSPGTLTRAIRWSEDEGIEFLGNVPNSTGDHHSNAFASSYDGSIIVGRYSTGPSYNPRAFVWDQLNGMRSLQDVLVNELGIDLTGWDLKSATAVSGNGLAIVGQGSHNGRSEGWIAVIPEPTSSALYLFGFLTAHRHRKRLSLPDWLPCGA